METKTCTKCLIDYPISSYTKHATRKDGKSPICVACLAIKRRSAYLKKKGEKEIEMSSEESKYWEMKSLMETNSAIL